MSCSAARQRAERRPHIVGSIRRSEGFTLLEVLVVLVILAVIAALVAGPQIFKYLGAANTKAAEVKIEQIGGALDFFRLEVGRYPNQEENLNVLISRPEAITTWNGPYLKNEEALNDPWGRPFVYVYPGQHGEYDLFSLGADNSEGGEGEDRDIKNW